MTCTSKILRWSRAGIVCNPTRTNVPQSLAEKTNIEAHVFVVTYGRSGSTLVQNLLNAIPGYCIRGENENVLGSLAQGWRHVAESVNIRNVVRDGVESTPEHPWFGAERIDPNQFGRSLARVFTREILRPPAGTRVTGFKEIRWGATQNELNTVLNFAFRFFRRARFVFNTREPAEVARSSWWAKLPEADAIEQIRAADLRFSNYMEKFPDRCLHIHYNDYVADHESLRPLFDFLGEDWDSVRVADVMNRRLTHLKTMPG